MKCVVNTFWVAAIKTNMSWSNNCLNCFKFITKLNADLLAHELNDTHLNLAFRTPNDLSTTFLVLAWAILYLLWWGSFACMYGVISHVCNGYPLSPRRHPVCCLLKSSEILEFLKINESWVAPGHLTTMFVNLQI